MKKLTSFTLAFVLATAILSGCRKTPDSPFVIPKDNSNLISQAMNNPDSKTLAEMVNAPEKLVLSKTDGSGTVTVNADAEIVIPVSSGITTMTVAKRSFTQAEADTILSYFIEDKAFASTVDGYTEEERQLMDFYDLLSRETDPDLKAQLQASIDKFESAGIKVPDANEVLPASKTFAADKASGAETIRGYAGDNDHSHYLSIINASETNIHKVFYSMEKNGYATSSGYYWYEKDIENAEKVGNDPDELRQIPLEITPENAAEQARHVIDALGISDMTLYSCDEVWGGAHLMNGSSDYSMHHGYMVRFVRSVGGIPIIYTESNITEGYQGDYEDPNDLYFAAWPYEEIHIVIDGSGIVEFVWQSPYEVVETVTNTTALKPFAEIKDIFERMILVTNATGADDAVEITIDISKAELGMMRVAQPDHPDTALLIPVWDFFGSRTMVSTGVLSEQNNPYQSFLTINAIDGTIIDRYLGY